MYYLRFLILSILLFAPSVKAMADFAFDEKKETSCTIFHMIHHATESDLKKSALHSRLDLALTGPDAEALREEQWTEIKYDVLRGLFLLRTFSQLDWDEGTSRKISSSPLGSLEEEIYFFLVNNIQNPQNLEKIFCMLPPTFMTERQKLNAKDRIQCVLQHVHDKNQRELERFLPPVQDFRYFLEALMMQGPSMLSYLSESLRDLQKSPRKPKMVSVGNTPAWLLKTWEILFGLQEQEFPYDLNYVALSGHPDLPKYTNRFIDDIVTPDGLENYRWYLEMVGFFQETQEIILIDIMASAKGPQFLVNELRRHCKEKKHPFPNITIFNLRHTSEMQSADLKREFLEIFQDDAPPNIRFMSVPEELYLASVLDQCPDALRFMPKCSGLMWDEKEFLLKIVKETGKPFTKEGVEFEQSLRSRIKEVQTKIELS